MAIAALHSAATGLSALSTQIDVIANNLANSNTTAFKSSRVNFEDLLYQEKAQPGVVNANGDERPAGIQVGMGVRVANTDRNFQMGSPINTDRPFDLIVQRHFQYTPTSRYERSKLRRHFIVSIL